MDPLDIVLRLVDEQALAQLRQFGDQAKRVVQDLAQDQKRRVNQEESDNRAYIDAIKLRLAAEKQLDKEAAAAHKQVRAELTANEEKHNRAYIDAIKLRLAAEKQLDKEAAAAHKQVRAEIAADEERHDRAYIDAVKLRVAAEKQLDKEAAAVRKQVRAEIAADEERQIQDIEKIFKDARDAEVQAEKNAHRVMADEQKDATRRRSETEAARAAENRQKIQEELKLADDQKNSILNIARAYTALRIASQVSQDIHAVWRLIADEEKRARDLMKEWSSELERAREGSVELARLLGQKPTGQFVAAQAQEAASVGMRREEWQRFQLQFHEQVGGRVAPPGTAPTRDQMLANGYATTTSEATAFQRMAASYATNVEGLSGDQAAKLAANVVQTAPVGATAAQMMDQFVRMARLAVRARGGTNQMIESVGNVAAEFAQNDQSGRGDWERSLRYGALASVMAERNPDQVVTSVRALDRWARQARKDQKKEMKKQGWSRLGELGITPEMTEDPEAMVAQLSAKRDQWLAAGKSEQAFEDRYAGNYQFSFTAFRTAARRNDVMRRNLAEAKARTGIAARAETRSAMTDVNGPAMQRADEARIEAAVLRQGQATANLRHYERMALEQLIGSEQLAAPQGILEAASAEARARLGYGSAQEQMIRERANSLMEADLKAAAATGSPQARRFVRQHPLRMRIDWENVKHAATGGLKGKPNYNMFGEFESEAVRGEAAHILASILEEQQKQTKMMEDERRRGGAPQAQAAAPAPLPARVPMQGGGVRP